MKILLLVLFSQIAFGDPEITTSEPDSATLSLEEKAKLCEQGKTEYCEENVNIDVDDINVSPSKAQDKESEIISDIF